MRKKRKKSDGKNTELTTAKVLLVIAFIELIEKIFEVIEKLIDRF